MSGADLQQDHQKSGNARQLGRFRAWVFLMVLANLSEAFSVSMIEMASQSPRVRAGRAGAAYVKLEKAGMARWRDDNTIELINFRELQYDYLKSARSGSQTQGSSTEEEPSTSKNERGTSKNERGTSRNE